MAAGDLSHPTARAIARTAACAVSWIAALTLAARHAAGTWQLTRTLTWLAEHEPEPPLGGQQPTPPVHVVVPVLREQEHVGAALAWWRTILPLFPGMSLTLVSTAREDHDRALLARAVCNGPLNRARFPQLTAEELAALRTARQHGHLRVEGAAAILARAPRTCDVIDQALADAPNERIGHLTYPGLGRKAAQINHAARVLPADGYIAVYDVDSRPDAKALAAVYACLADRPPMVQQHALHTPSAAADGAAQQALTRGAAVLQSIWTVRREVPYARRYQRFAGQPGVWARGLAGLSQPVGHGLYVRGDVLAATGGFPEASVLDDVPTGVALTLAGIPTRSVPYLTTVPAPDSVGEIIAQGRRWFCSYLDYPAILRTVPRGTGTAWHRRLVAGVAVYRGTAWLAAGPITVTAVLAAVSPRSGIALRATAFAGLALAGLVPVILTAHATSRSRVDSRRPSPVELGLDCGALLAAYVLRSVGPWLAVVDALRGRHPATAAAPAPKAHRQPPLGATP